jgi:hypothetical protein
MGNHLNAGLYGDAVDYTKKRVASLENLPVSHQTRQNLIRARTDLGVYCIMLNSHIDAKQAVDPVIESAFNQNIEKTVPKILIILGTYDFVVEGNFLGAFEKLEKALEIIDHQKDVGIFAFATYWLGLALSLDCQFGRALLRIPGHSDHSFRTKTTTHSDLFRPLIPF